jgi:prepilin-type N-terminal cleavage/methylation domain-containing protein
VTDVQGQRGFTLIEVLIAVAVFGVATVYVMQTFTNQHKAYAVIDQVSEAQQNGRVVTDLIERDLRHAGYMVPAGAGVCGADSTVAPDALFVSDSDAILPIDQLPLVLRSAELGASVVGANAGWQVAAGSRDLVLSNLHVDVAAGGADFAVGRGLILADRSDPFGGVSCGKITEIAGNTVTVELGTDFGPAGNGADVVAIPAHVYEVDGQRRLLRDGSLLVEGVDDLQVAYFFDLDDDSQIDADEVFGDGSGPISAGYSPDAAAIDGVALRQVRFNVVVATRSEDPRSEYQLGRRQITENRTEASTAGSDGRRRRVHSVSVRMRNGVS